MMRMIEMPVLMLCNQKWMLDVTSKWALIERRMQTCKKLDLLQTLKRLVLIRTLGKTLGMGTNFIAAMTLYSGPDLQTLGGTLELETNFRRDVSRARTVTQFPKYCLERDLDPKYLQSDVSRACAEDAHFTKHQYRVSERKYLQMDASCARAQDTHFAKDLVVTFFTKYYHVVTHFPNYSHNRDSNLHLFLSLPLMGTFLAYFFSSSSSSCCCQNLTLVVLVLLGWYLLLSSTLLFVCLLYSTSLVLSLFSVY